MNNENNELRAIRALATASQTPFKTAFKATLGMAVAQLTVLVVVLTLFVIFALFVMKLKV